LRLILFQAFRLWLQQGNHIDQLLTCIRLTLVLSKRESQDISIDE
jgi:hypothetical protein